MKKLLTLLPIIVLACLAGGLYGIIHDQLTYTISPEYYTKFKFYQFGLMDTGDEAIFPHPRVQVSAVGFMATWWMGLPVGLLLGLAGLIHRDSATMFRVTLQAFLLTMSIAFLTGLAGLAYGHFFLARHPAVFFTGWYLPPNLADYKSFIAVGSMHNFSYIGGVLGLIGGMIYTVAKKARRGRQAVP